MGHCTYIKESCRMHPRVMSHTWMSHVTNMNESCHTSMWALQPCVLSYGWVTSHTWISHTYEWVMSHVSKRMVSHTWMSHVTRMQKSRYTYKRVTSRTENSHVTVGVPEANAQQSNSSQLFSKASFVVIWYSQLRSELPIWEEYGNPYPIHILALIRNTTRILTPVHNISAHENRRSVVGAVMSSAPRT